MTDTPAPVGWPWSFATTLNTLKGRAESRLLPLTLTPIAGTPVTWTASLGTITTRPHKDVEAAANELERGTR